MPLQRSQYIDEGGKWNTILKAWHQRMAGVGRRVPTRHFNDVTEDGREAQTFQR